MSISLDENSSNCRVIRDVQGPSVLFHDHEKFDVQQPEPSERHGLEDTQHTSSPLRVEKQDAVRSKVLTRGEDHFAFIVFLCIGTSGLLVWNSLLSTLPSILNIIFPTLGSFTDTATATYFSVVCSFTLLFTAFPITRIELVLLALGGLVCECLAVPLICWLSPVSMASLWFHLFCGSLGCFVAMTVSSGIAIASTLPKLYVTGVASGMGFAGILSFTVWMSMSHGLLQTNRTVDGILKATWILFGLGAIFITLSMVLVVIFVHRPWLVTLMAESERTLHYDKTQSGSMPAIHHRACRFFRTPDFARLKHAPSDGGTSELVTDSESGGSVHPLSYTSLGLFGVIRTVARNTTLRFFIFFQTLLVFPNIGPLAWKDTVLIQEVVMGTFQLLDSAGRFSPHAIPALVISELGLFFGLILRTVIVVWFILSMLFSHQPFFGSSPFHVVQMAALAFTNGWFSTVATIHLPGHVNGVKAKSVASSFGISIGFFGIVAGQWSSKLLKLLLL